MKRPPRSVFLRGLLPASLMALLLLPVDGASFAAGPPAGSAPAVADNTAPSVPAGTDNAAGPVPAADNGWVDRTHSLVEKDLFETAVWFDHFFGDERLIVTDSPVSYLRWTNALRWDQKENVSFRSTIRATLHLPRLQKRWKLVFTGENRGDPNAVTPEDPGNPGLNLGTRVHTGSTELVYDLYRTTRSILDLGAGVRVKIPPDAFVRMRFQHARPLMDNILGRYTGTAFWDARDGPGESNQVDIERWLAPPTLLRWSNSLQFKEKDHGWTWGTDLSLLYKISPKSAITFAAGVSGSIRPAWMAQDYRVLVRYRRNVLRKWLFLEGEPDIHWPKEADGSRKPVWGATLRVEILFTGAGPRPPDGGGNGN